MNSLSVHDIYKVNDICNIVYSGIMTNNDRVDLSRYIKESDKNIVLVNFIKMSGEK